MGGNEAEGGSHTGCAGIRYKVESIWNWIVEEIVETYLLDKTTSIDIIRPKSTLNGTNLWEETGVLGFFQ